MTRKSFSHTYIRGGCYKEWKDNPFRERMQLDHEPPVVGAANVAEGFERLEEVLDVLRAGAVEATG